MLGRYFTQHMNEIKTDRILRIYGAMVSLFLVVCALYWLKTHAYNFISEGSEPICWAMFNDCSLLRVLDTKQLTFLFYGLGITSLITAALFLFSKTVSTAYWMLIGLNVIKHIIIFIDFRLRLNQHLMAFWITLAFLFLPRKKVTIRILIILFYFWAGILKLNNEWLSGSALYIKPWLFEGQSLIFACYYVVILEIAFTWGLLFDRTKIAWAVFLQLVVFHIFSFKIVGFFYPILMFLMISIFPLCWVLDDDEPSIFRKIIQQKIPPIAIIVVVIFSALQVYPKTLPRDTAITGEGRLFSLHMFDALTVCKPFATIKLTNGQQFQQNIHLPTTARIHCDPLVYFNRARNICRNHKSNSLFSNMDLALFTKRTTDKEFKKVIDIKNFCSQRTPYLF